MSEGRGFSIIEMMVTIVVLMVLLAMALPAWQTFVRNERLNTARDNLANALSQARGSAVSDNDVVTVCPYNASASGSCGSNWGQGWAIFEQQGASSVLLKAWPVSNAAAPTVGTLATGTASGAIASVSFNPRPPYVAVAQTGDFRFCDSRGASYALSFNLQTTGYVQYASSIGQTLGGATLSCP
ncbi:GspH/FimT family pseudopilin [Chromobacterium sp. IIBBL 290-4]|uniref:GspH/FimT family pseudopilin n=1 Tax=Chromobacterium sp. IIBBL 290-4 TaxID=2953890 RepID=UPI0020B7F146|nr:GspH/FimT family pseudopilin [Chromobacterium sp. IIBBL 290-4]UTH76169.1 GspH/FimT family pseudopilin [Chromobacterium sp. IIBBL 290-4]